MDKEKNLTARLMRQFDCEANDVYFAMLISKGLPLAEAYIAIFRPLTAGGATLARKHIRENPQINSLITYLSAEKTTAENNVLTEDVSMLVESYKDKDFIIAELIKSLSGLKGKDRAEVLNKIADLQQMKKEEMKNDEERVHFYLPLPICKDCPNKNKLVK
jgi:hypothetical protein